MASTSETGHAKNISNFGEMIEACESYGVKYNPSEAELELTALTAQHAACDAAHEAVKNPLAIYGQKVGERKELFEGLDPLVTRLINRFDLSKAPANVKKSARTLANKIRGMGKRTQDPPEGEAPEDDDHSTSQRSYTMMADNFGTLISILDAEPTYDPAEVDLQVTTLQAMRTSMDTLADNVGVAFEALRTVRNTRNELLYGKETGLVDTAYSIKKYVLSVYNARSVDYKKVSVIKFSRPTKRKKKTA